MLPSTNEKILKENHVGVRARGEFHDVFSLENEDFDDVTTLIDKKIAKATLIPDTSYIAKPAASWLDDFLVWVSPEAFGCAILELELDESQLSLRNLLW
ncbi:uncharacterized protein HKW66_Vig0224360 [Vigna angularis]|uniref:Uncharacterized protein n=1 Tax=Phaseolus angularis TaxID=3914 RepID=A0A8T0JZF2_PHAAN|nr:uncharacterized protein HKW66_Vig0224360 [Vigna angularis]